MARPPANPGTPDGGAGVLTRLTALATELAGAHEPPVVVDQVAAALDDLVHPDHITIALLDLASNRLVVARHRGPGPARPDDALVQLALRRGPLLVADRDTAGAADLGPGAPGSWIGAPILAVGRAIGAVSLGADAAGAFTPRHLDVVTAVLAQAAMALENTRLVELLSSGKREWELAVDGITQAICIIDANGVVRRANHGFAGLVERPVTALPGVPWLELVPPAWTEGVANALAHAGGGAFELRTGGRTLLVSAIPVGGEHSGAAVLLFEDQTDKRRLQEQLIQSEKMSAIGQLIAGIAHDLNNPLTSVVGFADYLVESGEVPAALAEPLDVIRQEAERAATIVKNLLSFARRQEERRETQPIRPILESTLALLRNELTGLRVDASLHVEEDLPAIEVNANQIKQVFVNLIANAAQAIAASGHGGRVWVRARKWLDGVAIDVVDDGPGIPDAVAQRVFEPFFTTKPEGEGTGLGLSICQGIVKEHGGRLTLETRPGEGATFTVELPGGTRAGRPSAPIRAPSAGARLRILVVDDEPHILHYLRATLESWGHAVALAADGTEALTHALGAPFDVVICDLRMPRLGGREMYRRLEAEHPELARRIIFATGDTVRGDTLDFLESLHRPYLHKPFTLEELRQVLGGLDRPEA